MLKLSKYRALVLVEHPLRLVRVRLKVTRSRKRAA